MATVMISEKYCGEGGYLQRIFIADAKKRWSELKSDVARQTQFDFIKSLRARMESQACQVLENYVETWDHTNPLNPNLVPPAAREVLRVPWRAYYKALAVYRG